MFSCEFSEIFKNIFSTEHLQATVSKNTEVFHEKWSLDKFFLCLQMFIDSPFSICEYAFI